MLNHIVLVDRWVEWILTSFLESKTILLVPYDRFNHELQKLCRYREGYLKFI